MRRKFYIAFVMLILLSAHAGCDKPSQPSPDVSEAPVESDQEPQISVRGVDSRHVSVKDRPRRYSRSWAILIGISYDENAFAPNLECAQNDSIAVAERLIDHYGYSPEHVFLLGDMTRTKKSDLSAALIGVNVLGATLDEINQGISNVLRQAAAEDSVLIYFSGHGSDMNGEVGLLWPSDVLPFPGASEVDNADTPHPSSCIRTDQLLKSLHFSLAKHRLLIVDCCHSGATLEGVNEYGGITERFFASSATIALCSGRWNEPVRDVANDIRRGHSPFTGSLLNFLEQPAITTNDKLRFFTTESLRTGIAEQISEANQRRRAKKSGNFDYPLPFLGSIRIGKATDPQGDFFFFPVKEFNSTNLVMQSLPGLRGGSWFEEMPWYIPHVRAMFDEIARSTRYDQLQTTAGVAISNPRNPDVAGFLNDLYRRLDAYYAKNECDAGRWMKKLASGDRNDAAHVLKELLTIPELKRNAWDWHLIAVLQQHLNLGKQTDFSFKQAIGSYQQSEPNSPLAALCTADFAHYLADIGLADDCLVQCKAALDSSFAKLPEIASDPYFLIALRHTELQSHRRLRNFVSANETIAVLDSLGGTILDEAHPHPLVIYGYERKAWAFLDQTRLKEAAETFNRSLVFRNQLNDETLAARLEKYHLIHGLAVAECLHGDRQAAIKRLTELLPQIDNLLDDCSVNEKLLVLERAVNSYERLADFYLFSGQSTPQDVLRSIDSLQEAVRRAQTLIELKGQSSSDAAFTEVCISLHCKLSIAHAESQSLDSANSALDVARKLKSTIPDNLVAANTRLLQASASLACEKMTPHEFRDFLRPYLSSETEAGRNMSRLDNEVVVVGCLRLLNLDQLEEPWKPMSQALLNWRSRPDASRIELRRYLRPFGDAVIKSQFSDYAECKIEGDRELIAASIADEIVRVRSEKTFFRGESERPTLIVHLFHDQGGLLMLMPSRRMKNESRAQILVSKMSSSMEMALRSVTKSTVAIDVFEAELLDLKQGGSSVALLCEDNFNDISDDITRFSADLELQPINY